MNKSLLLLITIVLASCTTEYVQSDKVSITADVFQNAPSPSPSGKNIKRGTIYAWVKEVTLSATNFETGYVASEVFTLVDNNSSNTNSGTFRLDNVAIGQNAIRATSTTSSIGALSFGDNIKSPSQTITDAVKLNPYAVYSTIPLMEDIRRTPNNVIKVPMHTLNGRVIGVFSSSESYVLANYKLEVKADVIKTNGVRVNIGTSFITSTNSPKFYWSDEESVDGTEVLYTINVISKRTNKIEHTFTESITLKGSTSYSCNYVVKTSTELFKDDNKFDFVFQKWNEEYCPTCPKD